MSTDPPLPSPEVLLEHASWLRRLAGELLRDPSSAEDIAQETWLAYLKNRPDADRPLRPWLARVLRNRAAMRLRGSANRRAREADVARAEAIPSSDRLVERAEVQRQLVEAVLALENPYRETLLLRYYEGLTPKQIAEVRGIEPATVRTHLFRGHAKLREVLDERHGGDRSAWSALLAPLARPLVQATPTALVGLGPSSILLTLGLVLTGALLLRPILSKSADAPDALRSDRPANDIAGSSPNLPARLGPGERAPVVTPGTGGTREVRLVDARTGTPLPSFRIDADGERLSTDTRGIVRLAESPRSIVLVDDDRLAIDAIVAHGARAERPHEPIVLDEADLRRAFAEAREAADPCELPVSVGPSLGLTFETDLRVAFTELDARLVADGLSPYLDDGLPRQVAPVRSIDELGPKDRAGIEAWVRFAQRPLGADDPSTSWRLVVRDRAGLVHGSALLSNVATAFAPVAVTLQRTARIDGSLRSSTSAAGVEVRLLAESGALIAGAFSDESGRFDLRWVKPGNYSLRVESPVHRPVEQALVLHAGERIAVDLELDALPPGGRIAGSVRSESGTYDGQLLVFLLGEGERVLGVYPTTWREEQGELRAPFEFDEVPGSELRLDIVSLSDAVSSSVSPEPLRAPCSTVDVLLRDRASRADVDFRARDADTGAALETFEVEVEVDEARRRFLASGTEDARRWTLIVGGMRWNDFDGSAPLRDLAVDAELSWTVRADGYAPKSGTLGPGAPKERREVVVSLKRR